MTNAVEIIRDEVFLHTEFLALVQRTGLVFEQVAALVGAHESQVLIWVENICAPPPGVVRMLKFLDFAMVATGIPQEKAWDFACDVLEAHSLEAHEILGVPRDAGLDEAETARKLLAEQYHPYGVSKPSDSAYHDADFDTPRPRDPIADFVSPWTIQRFRKGQGAYDEFLVQRRPELGDVPFHAPRFLPG